jgi:hypothetical protein
MGNVAYDVGSDLPPVWPAGQQTEKIGHDSILLTRFNDIGAYHPGLMARLFQVEADPTRAKRYAGCGGVKIHSLTELQCREAELIDARARFLFRLVSGAPDAVVDISWANIYRQNDYCMPHSHIRSMASVVYMVDEGEADEQDPVAGRFCFVDPRLEACCNPKPQYMTSPVYPVMPAGTMIIFPSQLVHYVNPYSGRRPRITLSWNINATAVPGEPMTGME